MLNNFPPKEKTQDEIGSDIAGYGGNLLKKKSIVVSFKTVDISSH